MFKVYVRENIKNGKKYIGVTKRTLGERAGNDGWLYITGTPNTPFAKAINKYGWKSFKSQVLFEFSDEETALDKEKELIKYYNTTDINFGYNTIINSFSEVSSHKGSNNGMYEKGYKLLGNKNGRARSVLVKFPNKLEMTFDTQKDAREYLGISKDMFRSVRDFNGPFRFSKMTNKSKIEKNSFLTNIEIIVY